MVASYVVPVASLDTGTSVTVVASGTVPVVTVSVVPGVFSSVVPPTVVSPTVMSATVVADTVVSATVVSAIVVSATVVSPLICVVMMVAAKIKTNNFITRAMSKIKLIFFNKELVNVMLINS